MSQGDGTVAGKFHVRYAELRRSARPSKPLHAFEDLVPIAVNFCAIKARVISRALLEIDVNHRVRKDHESKSDTGNDNGSGVMPRNTQGEQQNDYAKISPASPNCF